MYSVVMLVPGMQVSFLLFCSFRIFTHIPELSKTTTPKFKIQNSKKKKKSVVLSPFRSFFFIFLPFTTSNKLLPERKRMCDVICRHVGSSSVHPSRYARCDTRIQNIGRASGLLQWACSGRTSTKNNKKTHDLVSWIWNLTGFRSLFQELCPARFGHVACFFLLFRA